MHPERLMLNWESLSPQDFEELCGDLVRALGFVNIKWHGKGGGDRGRDFVAEKPEELFAGKKRMLKVIVQCKHYSSSIGPSALADTIAWAQAYQPDILLFMISSFLTSQTKDWLSEIERSHRFRIYTLERSDLEIQLVKHPQILEQYFAKDNAMMIPAWSEGDQLMACGYCGSNRIVTGGYLVYVSCDGCSHVAAMCIECIGDHKSEMPNEHLGCVECGKELSFSDASLVLNRYK